MVLWTRSYKIIKEGKVEGRVKYSTKDYKIYAAEIILKDLYYFSDVKSDLKSEGCIIQGKPLELVRTQTKNKLEEIFGEEVLKEGKFYIVQPKK